MTIANALLGKAVDASMPGGEATEFLPRERCAVIDTEADRCKKGSSKIHYLPFCLLLLFIGGGVVCIEVYRTRELWNLRSEIDILKLEVQELRQRTPNDDFLDELKAFEEAVREEKIVKEDVEEEDSDNNYDEDDDYSEYEEYDDYIGEEGKRTRRHIEETPDGVPVIDASYGVLQNRSSEGLRLYESLVSSGNDDPRSPDVSWETTENPIKEYHRVSPLWSSKQRRKKWRESSGPQFADQVVYQRSKGKPPATSEAPMIERKSRVKQTKTSQGQDHARPSYPRTTTAPPPTSSEEVLVRVYQAPETRSNVAQVRSSIPRRIRRRQGTRRRFAAVHYHGDSSNYTINHPNYRGNGRLRHPDMIFRDWSPTSWSSVSKFHLHRGILTIREGGVYFFYAQIFYVDAHDINGYVVNVNDMPVLQCTTMTHTSHSIDKENSCYTGSALLLKQGDTVYLKDLEDSRYSIFRPEKSFFGLIKLHDYKP